MASRHPKQSEMAKMGTQVVVVVAYSGRTPMAHIPEPTHTKNEPIAGPSVIGAEGHR